LFNGRPGFSRVLAFLLKIQQYIRLCKPIFLLALIFNICLFVVNFGGPYNAPTGPAIKEGCVIRN
jgi:hypothetical protein